MATHFRNTRQSASRLADANNLFEWYALDSYAALEYFLILIMKTCKLQFLLTVQQLYPEWNSFEWILAFKIHKHIAFNWFYLLCVQSIIRCYGCRECDRGIGWMVISKHGPGNVVFITRGQVWPSGIVVACVCVCVLPSVRAVITCLSAR